VKISLFKVSSAALSPVAVPDNSVVQVAIIIE
jgi:hypothetical protein